MFTMIQAHLDCSTDDKCPKDSLCNFAGAIENFESKIEVDIFLSAAVLDSFLI